MNLNLVRTILASAMLWPVPGGAVLAEAQSTGVEPRPSSVCSNILHRMQAILDKRDKGLVSAGTAPQSLWDLKPGVSVSESRRSPEHFKTKNNANCFKLSGRWSMSSSKDIPVRQPGVRRFPTINAYVFFEIPDVGMVSTNLSVGTIFDRGTDRYIPFSVWSKGEWAGHRAGVASQQKDIQKIQDSIIWLDEKPQGENLVEVVLCQGSCRDILANRDYNTAAKRDTGSSILPSRTGAEQKPVVDVNTGGGNPAGAGGVGAGSAGVNADRGRTGDDNLRLVQRNAKDNLRQEIRNELRQELEIRHQEISDQAIAVFLSSTLKYKFVNESGYKLKSLGPENLFLQKCEPSKNAVKSRVWTKRIQELIAYPINRECISINPASGYEVKEPNINFNDPPTVTFIVRKAKPAEISAIKIEVEMADGSRITGACTLQAEIIDPEAGEDLYIGTFSSTNRKPRSHVFFLVFDEPVVWKDKLLVLRRLKGADCQPKDGEMRVPLTSRYITQKGVLKLPETVHLHSTQGKALLVLNTMIGLDSVNGSESSREFYPNSEDEQLSREIITEMAIQSLQQLRGKARGLIVGHRQSSGELRFEDYSQDFKTMSAKTLGKRIVENSWYAKSNFVWATMVNAVNRHIAGRDDFTYRIFIGQSGLSNDRNYCQNRPRMRSLAEQGHTTFIYDFATTANLYNPPLAGLKGPLRMFPAKMCDKNARHVVFFAGAVRSGWQKTVSSLFKTAFRGR